MKGKTVTMEKSGTLTIAATGKLEVTGVKLRAQAKMTVNDGSVVGTSGSGFNVNSLSMGPEAEVFFAKDVVVMTATEMEMMYGANIKSQSNVKDFTVSSTTLTMFDNAGLDVSGGGNTAGMYVALLYCHVLCASVSSRAL